MSNPGLDRALADAGKWVFGGVAASFAYLVVTGQDVVSEIVRLGWINAGWRISGLLVILAALTLVFYLIEEHTPPREATVVEYDENEG